MDFLDAMGSAVVRGLMIGAGLAVIYWVIRLAVTDAKGRKGNGPEEGRS